MEAAPAASDLLRGAWAALRPPPRLPLSLWADQNFRLSPESAAEPGKWRTLPYQRAIMDAITDPSIERVTVMKSSRVGYTKSIDAAVAYFMSADPCPVMVVQPTLDTAKLYSKEEITPMLRDVEVLDGLVSNVSVKDSGNTVLYKTFPGGSLSLVGANSGKGFRMVSRRVVIFDEVDAYPPSAGNEGDPIKLGEKRAETYWNRKIVAGSTPLVAGASRIEELYQAGDRRRYYVPCPHCGHMDYFRFSIARGGDDSEEKVGDDRGHLMRWGKDGPDSAHFVCQRCGCAIDESHKLSMIAKGEWRGEVECRGHASFHIWAAYSTSPGATWREIVARFLQALREGVEKLRTFVNTELGESWVDRGEAPDWERLYDRREQYPTRTVPDGPLMLTAGVDVQNDRFVYEVVGWAANRESWSVDAGDLYGDTADEATWGLLDELLARSYPREPDGREMPISILGVDSGFRTQMAYSWARQHPLTRVIATKGVADAQMIIGAPSFVDVTTRGRRMQRGYRVFPIGVNIAKSELYGFLRLRIRGGVVPAGYCHFPEHPEEFFKQLTAEHLVTVVHKITRRTERRWVQLPNRENHYLDTRIIARACASLLGIDRLAAKAARSQPHQRTAVTPAPTPSSPAPPPMPPAPVHESAPRAGSWISSGGARPVGGGWLRRRR